MPREAKSAEGLDMLDWYGPRMVGVTDRDDLGADCGRGHLIYCKNEQVSTTAARWE